jgi:hypothetical protein
MVEQPEKPIFTGRPPGKKLPNGLHSADRNLEKPVTSPIEVETPAIVEKAAIIEQPKYEPAPGLNVQTIAESTPVAKTAPPETVDRRRHLKTLLAAAGLVTIFGAITGVVLANAVHGISTSPSSLPAKPVASESASPPLEPVSEPDSTKTTSVESSVEPSLKPTLKPSLRPTTKASTAPEAPVEIETPRAPQLVTYTLKETQACHAKVSAELQILTNGSWSFLANPDGWDRPAKCPDTNPYQPFVTKELLEGTTIRWRVYSSAWEWFSKPVTLG